MWKSSWKTKTGMFRRKWGWDLREIGSENGV
jgi:hypothetical protein